MEARDLDTEGHTPHRQQNISAVLLDKPGQDLE